MSDNVLTDLRRLSLGPMAEALQHQMQQPGTYDDLSFTERLSLLVDHEIQCRRQRRQQRLIRAADFRVAATLNEVHYDETRNLDRRRIAELGQCDWIGRSQNLMVTGPCGSGKTYLACAIGHAACLLDHTVRYLRLPALLQLFAQARATGEFLRVLQRLGAVELIIIDDFGLRPMEAVDRHDLLELMDRRYGRASIAIVSQLPMSQWHDAVGDATLADAILDRVVHNAHRIELTGKSMRRQNAVIADDAQPDPGAGAGL